jgi:hypothetical protein
MTAPLLRMARLWVVVCWRLKWAQLLTLLGPIPGGNVWKNIIVGIERSYYLVAISGLFLLLPAGRRQSGWLLHGNAANKPYFQCAHNNNNNNNNNKQQQEYKP